MPAIWLVTTNDQPLRAFTIRTQCLSYLKRVWPQAHERLRVLKLRDGYRRGGKCKKIKDVTASFYGLEEEKD